MFWGVRTAYTQNLNGNVYGRIGPTLATMKKNNSNEAPSSLSKDASLEEPRPSSKQRDSLRWKQNAADSTGGGESSSGGSCVVPKTLTAQSYTTPTESTLRMSSTTIGLPPLIRKRSADSEGLGRFSVEPSTVFDIQSNECMFLPELNDEDTLRGCPWKRLQPKTRRLMECPESYFLPTSPTSVADVQTSSSLVIENEMRPWQDAAAGLSSSFRPTICAAFYDIISSP